MKKIFKIAVICLFLFLGLASSFFIGKEVYRNIGIILKGDYHLEDLTLLIPLGTSVLCIPSILFQLKTLRLHQTLRSFEENILDHDLLDQMSSNQKKLKIGPILWICNFVFALGILILGVILLILLREIFPINKLPNGLDRYLFAIGLLILGASLIIDEWKMKLAISLYKQD